MIHWNSLTKDLLVRSDERLRLAVETFDVRHSQERLRYAKNRRREVIFAFSIALSSQ